MGRWIFKTDLRISPFASWNGEGAKRWWGYGGHKCFLCFLKTPVRIKNSCLPEPLSPLQRHGGWVDSETITGPILCSDCDHHQPLPPPALDMKVPVFSWAPVFWNHTSHAYMCAQARVYACMWYACRCGSWKQKRMKRMVGRHFVCWQLLLPTRLLLLPLVTLSSLCVFLLVWLS